MNIILTGSSGLLGQNLLNKISKLYKIYDISRKNSKYNVDLSNFINLKNLFLDIKPDLIINLAANTNLDEIENKTDLGLISNYTIVQNIVEYIKINDNTIKLIHLSTDNFYDEKFLNTESDIKILNNYALSKYLSELACLDVKSLILRTNFFGKSIGSKKSFSDKIIETISSGKEIDLFHDVYFSPILMETLTDIIIKCINFDNYGIYNVGSHCGLSKYEFGKQICTHLSLDSNLINKIYVEDKQLIAKRPKDMRMNVYKFENTFNISLPSLKEEIKKLKL